MRSLRRLMIQWIASKAPLMRALVHASALIWWWIPFAHVLAPATLTGLLRNRNQDLHSHATAALAFNLWAMLLLFATYVLTGAFLGFVATTVVALTMVFFILRASARALRGVDPQYPFPKSVRHPKALAGALLGCFLLTIFMSLAMEIGRLEIDAETRKPTVEKYADPLIDTEWFSYAEISRFVYDPDHSCRSCKPGEPYDSGWRWKSLLRAKNDASGFFAQLFSYSDGKLVIAFRGTEPTDWRDLATDLAMGFGLKARQFRDAEQFYKEVRARYPRNAIQLTGHSLGGALAQYIGTKYGVRTVAFNGFGVAHILRNELGDAALHAPEITDRVFNVTQRYDVVSALRFPFTISQLWVAGSDSLFGTWSHHAGCKFWIPREGNPLNLLAWHSVALMENDAIFEQMGAPGGYKFEHCPPPKAVWEH